MSIVTMNRAIRYAIFPTEEQKIMLAQTFGCVRRVYNLGLELQEGLYNAGFNNRRGKSRLLVSGMKAPSI